MYKIEWVHPLEKGLELTLRDCFFSGSGILLKGMEHVPNIFISFDKYLFLEVINILI